ncbi:mucin-5AC-like [Watersipora subatra]|uniref:mucin-5AC-like n=1 Tax=Watersipora subatra TaxID=2589382 RepID=UPI00355BE3F4
MPPPTIKLGKQAGEHGSYAFYRSFSYMGRGKWRNVRLGKFFFVRMNKASPICIGELQLVWTGRYSSHPLASIRLFYLPEQLPEGRQSHHGQDELVSTEKMVLHVKDLIKWLIYDGVDWSRGLSLPRGSKASSCTCGKASDGLNCNVQIIDFTSYCRLRTALKRAEGKCFEDILSSDSFAALYGLKAINASHYIMFCKETFECAELENHDYRCDHLAPNLKGRPRKKGKGKKGKGTVSVLSNTNSNANVSSNASSASSTSTAVAEADEEAEDVKPVVDLDKDKDKYDKMLKHALTNKEYFTKALYKHMRDLGTPITKVPSLGFKQVDLHLFFKHAHSVGGFKEICRKRLWKHLYDRMGGVPHNTSAATCTKRQYERLLLSFEKHVVRSTVASKGVLPASQMSKLRKMNMAMVHRRHKKPSAIGSGTTQSLDTRGNDWDSTTALEKAGIEDSLDEDQIPLSKLKSECKDSLCSAVATRECSLQDVTSSKDALKHKLSQSVFSSGIDELKSPRPLKGMPIGVAHSAISAPLCTNAISSQPTVTKNTSVFEVNDNVVTPNTTIQAATKALMTILPAHQIVKANRPLNVLGPCHQHLLTDAQRSPWTTNLKKCYGDPFTVSTAQGLRLISDLKRSASGEVLDLSAKKLKIEKPTSSQTVESSFMKADDCGAIDLTMNKPLSLVKVKDEVTIPTAPWTIKSLKPQDEPLNFSKVTKLAEPETTCQRTPSLIHKESVSYATSVSRQTWMPPAVHSSNQYSGNLVPPRTAYLFTLPKPPPSYSSVASSIYSQRPPGRSSIAKPTLMNDLQIDLSRASPSSSTSTRFVGTEHARQQVIPNASTGSRHNHSSSPHMQSSTHSASTRKSDLPPRYGEHHELAYDTTRLHMSMAADTNHLKDARPRAPLNPITIPGGKGIPPSHDTRMISPRSSVPVRLSERMASPNNRGIKQRDPSHAVPFPPRHPSLKPLEHRVESMITSPRPMTVPTSQLKELENSRQQIAASFDQRQTDTAYRHNRHSEHTHKINNKAQRLTGNMSPGGSQSTMPQHVRPNTVSSHTPQHSPINPRFVPAAHSHKSSSLSPNQLHIGNYAPSSLSPYQKRSGTSPGTRLEYSPYPGTHQLSNTSTMSPLPQPLLHRLPTSPSASANLSSLPAPPRLQPMPKHSFPLLKPLYKK